MSSKPALLLVDVQQDYLARTGLSPNAKAFESALAVLIDSVRGLGWHVVHVQTRVSLDGRDAMPHLREADRAACVEGTPGALPPASLAPRPNEPVFHKRFYSGFEDPRLLQHLHEMKVETLIVAGVYTHACIRSTVLDAYAQGFRTFVPVDCLASYDPEHSQLVLDWMDGRAAQCLPSQAILASLSGRRSVAQVADPRIWLHRNPVDWSEVLDEVHLGRDAEVASTVERVARRQRLWHSASLRERTEQVATWANNLAKERGRWVEALIRDVGKPRMDAEGEVSYGLALLESVCAQLNEDEQSEEGRVRYRPHGIVGIITPWNNPFAIPIGKIAPALGYGNSILWKPALPASALSLALHESLAAVGLDNAVGLITGDAWTGTLLARAPEIAAVSFTGSIPVGRQLARLSGRLARPFQAELGGNNAAIVLADTDVAEVARDLAAAMFSFAGQRCTAIRRLIVQRDILEPFADALCAEVQALEVGQPHAAATQVGPVISKAKQSELLTLVQTERAAGVRVLTGGTAPSQCPAGGCWVTPTVVTDVAPESPIARDELFGPVVALMPADDLDQAIALHNACEQGLLGALFTHDLAHKSQFLAEAQAGILSINQARPRFAGSGPFVGWKASGLGVPEHGRWNRDFYTRTQAVYLDS